MADRAKKTTWKDVELFLMEWRVEMNAQFKELREPFQNLPKLQSVPIQIQEQTNDSPGACNEGNPIDLGANSGPRTSNSSANLIPGDHSAEGTRMTSLEENIRRLEQLQLDQARSITENAERLNRWRNSTNLSFDESGQKLEGQRIHSEGPQAQEQSEDGGNGKPEAILEVPFVAIVEPNEDDPKSTSFLSEILAIQPLAVNTTGIVSYKPLVSNFEENSENLKKQEEDQWLIEELPMGNPEQFTDMIGSTRNFSGDLPQESRDISSSLEIKFKEGNNRILDVPTITREIVTSEFVFEEISEVVDATVEPVGIIWAVVKMSKAENLEIHSAHHVFVKLFEEQLAYVTHSVALPSTLGDNCGTIESFGSFVFDPGKEIEFHYLSDQSHLESVETILVFDPGGDLLTLLLLSLCCYCCNSSLCWPGDAEITASAEFC